MAIKTVAIKTVMECINEKLNFFKNPIKETEKLMLNDGGIDEANFEEIEGENEVDERLYESEPDYEEEYTSEQTVIAEKIAKKAKAKAARKRFREEKKQLDQLSATFRRLEAALENPTVTKTVVEQAENQASLQFDVGLGVGGQVPTQESKVFCSEKT